VCVCVCVCVCARSGGTLIDLITINEAFFCYSDVTYLPCCLPPHPDIPCDEEDH
jgi:hypothetical protein